MRIRGQQVAEYANGMEESIGVTEPVIIELAGRETTEATLVTVQEAGGRRQEAEGSVGTHV